MVTASDGLVLSVIWEHTCSTLGDPGAASQDSLIFSNMSSSENSFPWVSKDGNTNEPGKLVSSSTTPCSQLNAVFKGTVSPQALITMKIIDIKRGYSQSGHLDVTLYYLPSASSAGLSWSIDFCNSSLGSAFSSF